MELSPSHLLLTAFQTTLLHFWEKTSHTMAAIHESFKGCQHYEASTSKVSERFTAIQIKQRVTHNSFLISCRPHKIPQTRKARRKLKTTQMRGRNLRWPATSELNITHPDVESFKWTKHMHANTEKWNHVHTNWTSVSKYLWLLAQDGGSTQNRP